MTRAPVSSLLLASALCALSQPAAAQPSGRLGPEVIQRVVRGGLARFRRDCYEPALRTNRNLRGRVAVRFVIGRDGNVITAANGGNNLPDGGVVSCYVQRFSSLRFPQPDGGHVVVTYPVMLTP